MQESLNIVQVCIRVLSDCMHNVEPDPQDIETVRKYVPAAWTGDADRLASAAIIRAVVERELARGALS